MAGYRITFDGSLNERLDIPMTSSTNSLTGSGVVNSPAAWLPIISSGVTQQLYSGTTAIPDTYITATTNSAQNVQVFYNTGALLFFNATAGGTEAFNFFTPSGLGDITWDFEYADNGDGRERLRVWKSVATATRNPNNSYNTLLQDTAFFGSVPTIISGSTNLGVNEWLTLEIVNTNLSSTNTRVRGVTISTLTSPLISHVEFTKGVAPTGGTLLNVTPSTLIGGQSGTAGAPKLFGAKVVHDASDVLSAKYLPPATSAQDAESKLSKSKYITATATSISVESEGLGGAEKLGAGKTSIVVENIPATVEN